MKCSNANTTSQDFDVSGPYQEFPLLKSEPYTGGRRRCERPKGQYLRFCRLSGCRPRGLQHQWRLRRCHYSHRRIRQCVRRLLGHLLSSGRYIKATLIFTIPSSLGSQEAPRVASYHPFIGCLSIGRRAFLLLYLSAFDRSLTPLRRPRPKLFPIFFLG